MRINEILTEKYYNGEQVRIIKTVKSADNSKIIQYKIEDLDKTWTDYVKPDQLSDTK